MQAGRDVVASIAAVGAPGGGLGPGLAVGVGIATGPAFVGNIQSTDRFIWTVIGNTVNLAARLQSMTRELEASVAIDDVTFRGAGAACADFVRHGDVSIRGRSRRETVHVLPADDRAATPSRGRDAFGCTVVALQTHFSIVSGRPPRYPPGVMRRLAAVTWSRCSCRRRAQRRSPPWSVGTVRRSRPTAPGAQRRRTVRGLDSWAGNLAGGVDVDNSGVFVRDPSPARPSSRVAPAARRRTTRATCRPSAATGASSPSGRGLEPRRGRRQRRGRRVRVRWTTHRQPGERLHGRRPGGARRPRRPHRRRTTVAQRRWRLSRSTRAPET